MLGAALLSEKRGEASAGSDSNCKTQAENPEPRPTPSIHPQRPQLPAPCSCCWAPRGSTSPRAKICPWRAPSTGGLRAGVIAMGGTATEAALLSHRALQTPRGPKTCACCSGGLSCQCSSSPLSLAVPVLSLLLFSPETAQPSKTRYLALLLSVQQHSRPYSSMGLAQRAVTLLFLLPTAREAVGQTSRLEARRRQTARPACWHQSCCCWSAGSALPTNFDQRELGCCANEKP